METVAYSLWCLRQAAPSDGTAPTLYDELGALFAHPDNYISDSGVVLNWMIDTLLKSVESPLGAVRAASWPGHYDPAKILRSMVDARSQGFNIKISAYGVENDVRSVIFFMHYQCYTTRKGSSVLSTYATKKQKRAAGDILLWASNDWELLNGIDCPQQCVSQCVASSDDPMGEQSRPGAQRSLHAIYDAIRGDTKRRQDGRRRQAAFPFKRTTAPRDSSPACALPAPEPKDLFSRLPVELSAIIMVHLDPRSLHSLSCCSKTTRQDCAGIMPGLKLRLYPHQYNSVWWMLDKEKKCSVRSSVSLRYRPLYRQALPDNGAAASRVYAPIGRSGYTSAIKDSEAGQTVDTGFSEPLLLIDRINGDIIPACSISNLDDILVNPTRGGMLCDEPGLGKTVTMLAVMLRTLGAESEPPAIPDYSYPGFGASPIVRPKRMRPSFPLFGSAAGVEVDIDAGERSTHVPFSSDPSSSLKIKNPVDTPSLSRSISAGRGLRKSCATLIIVPDTLLDHWQAQIDCHVAEGVGCRVYVDQPSHHKLPPIDYLSSRHIVLITNRRLGLEWKNTFPTTPTESAVTHRPHSFAQEFGPGGSRAQTPRKRKVDREDSSGSGCLDEGDFSSYNRLENVQPSVLHQIHWFRLVVDEGHTIGKYGSYSSNSALMASSISADRRWVLTGTPTPSGSQIMVSTQLRYLYQIFKFLKCEPLCCPGGDRIWKALIQTPFEMCSRRASGDTLIENSTSRCGDDSSIGGALVDDDFKTDSASAPEGQSQNSLDQVSANHWNFMLGYASNRLKDLLTEMMIRHVKEDVAEIPKPIFRQTRLHLSDEERTAYNAMVALVQSNVVTTENDYLRKNGTHQDSLLNPKNKKYLSEMLLNIRIAACGGGRARLVLPGATQRIDNCVKLLSRMYSSSTSINNPRVEQLTPGFGIEDEAKLSLAHQVQRLRNYIHTTLSEDDEKIKCEWCGMELLLLLVTPCVHLYCADCMRGMGDYCEICKSHFNWNDFQQLQPGFEASEYVYANPLLSEGTAAAPALDATTVHAGLSYGSPSALFSSSNTHTFDPDISDLRGISSKAKYLIRKIRALEMTYTKNISDETASSAYKPNHETLRNPNYVLTAAYSIELGSEDKRMMYGRPLLPKIIVFSQYLAFLDQIVIDLKLAGVSFSFFHGKNRAQALNRFRYCHDVRVLLLPREGSHGLDLSFVTHIFLMDTVFDESLEQQVISRAYRMGSKCCVVVDQLIMLNTIEEDIYRQRHEDRAVDIYSSGADQHQSEHVKGGKADRQFSRLERLVRDLRLIRSPEEERFFQLAKQKSTKEYPHGYWFESRSSRCHT